MSPHLTLLHTFALHPSPPSPPDPFGTRMEERLLAYLALRPGVARSRMDIVSTFWPDVETGKARKLLSLYLFKLKERLARSGVVDVIDDTRETLRLSPSIRTDAQEFAELVLAGTVAHSPVERARHLQAAVELYGDGLLPAYDYPWVTEQRQQLEVLYRHAVTSLADLLDPSGRMRDLLGSMPPSAWKGLARLAGRGEPSDAESDVGSADRSNAAPDARHSVQRGTSRPAASSPSKPSSPSAQSPTSTPSTPDAPSSPPSDIQPPIPNAQDLAPFIRHSADELRGADPQPTIDLLSDRIDAIRAVLLQPPTVASFPAQLGIAADLWRFWYVTRRVAEGRSYLEQLLITSFDAPPEVRAAALHAAGTLANLEGDREVGIPRLKEAAVLWHGLGDDPALLRTIINLALARHDAGEFLEARALHDEAIRLARRLGEERSLARALFNGALTELKLGDYRAARAMLEERLALPSAARDSRQQGVVYAHLATAALVEGDLAAARAAAETAIEALTAAPDASDWAIALCVMGRVHYLEGRMEEASAALERGAEHARDAKDMGLTGMVLGYLALVYERLGQPGMAAQCTMNATILMRSARADELLSRFEGGPPAPARDQVVDDSPAPDRVLAEPSLSTGTPGQPRSRPLRHR